MMSGNKAKDKGDRWERELAEYLSDHIINGKFKRIVGSGAIGTIAHESALTGDIKGEVVGFPLKFKGEAKARTGATQIAVKKEWLDKIIMEANQTYSIPFLACKFIGARAGVRSFIAVDVDTFCSLINKYIEVKIELDKILNEQEYGKD